MSDLVSDPIRALRTLVDIGWRHDRKRLVGVVAGELATAAIGLGQVVTLGWLIERAASDADAALVPAALLAALAAAHRMAGWMLQRASYRLRENLAARVECRVISAAAGIPRLDHHEQPRLRDRIERVRDDRWLVAQSVGSATQTLWWCARLGGLFFVLATVTPWLLLLPFAALVPILTSRHTVRHHAQLDDDLGEPYRFAVELKRTVLDPNAADDIRHHGLWPIIEAEHAAAYDRVHLLRARTALRTGVLQTIGDVALAAAAVGAVILVAALAVAGNASIGDVVVTLVLGKRTASDVGEAIWQVTSLIGELRAINRLQWLEDEADAAIAAHRPADTAPSVPARLTSGIRLNDVSFRYVGADRDAVRAVDLLLPAGRTVALVGDNGAGKTTLVSLLVGLHLPDRGSIDVDGTDLRQFPLQTWRQHITGAFQDAARFELTALDSIGVGDVSRLDEPTVRDAAERSGADPLIDGLPEGIHTLLGHGNDSSVQLSGGQWQQIALARSAMRPTPLLLLLDEPTTALDPIAEQALYDRYFASSKAAAEATGAVTVLVSHRLSTVRRADVIVVLAEGATVEVGSHDELIAADGHYAELFQMQAKRYQ